MNLTPELRYAVLELTNRCNLRCVHCASNSGVARHGEYTTEHWIAVVRELAKLGTQEVTLIGGEVLLHPGWERIGQEVTSQGMRLIFVTNGLLVDERTKDRILALKPWILGVSLDGATPETVRAIRGVEAFDHVYQLLLDLASMHPRVNAVTTFCRLNFHEFDDLARLFQGTGVTWQVQIANPSGERFRPEWSLSVEEYAVFCEKVTHILLHEPNVRICPMDDFGYHPLSPELANYHQRFPGCMAGIQVIGIRSDGAILPCLSLGDEFICAHLSEAPLTVLWADDTRFERFRNKHLYLTGECATCAFAKTCRGGCTAMAASNTGAFGENAYCMRTIETHQLMSTLLDSENKM